MNRFGGQDEMMSDCLDLLLSMDDSSSEEMDTSSGDFLSYESAPQFSSGHQQWDTDSNKGASKRIRKSKYVPVPRVLKRDVRKLYSAMFANVFNATDSELLGSFFNTFCWPNLHFTNSISPALCALRAVGDVADFAGSRQINSAEIASQFMNNYTMLYPDIAIQLTESKLHMRSDTAESMIVSAFTVSLTKIYDSSDWSEVMSFPDDDDNNNTSDSVNEQVNIIADQKDLEDDSQLVKRPYSSILDGNTATELVSQLGFRKSKPGDEQQQEEQEPQAVLVEAVSFAGKKGYQPCYTAKQQQAMINRTPLVQHPFNLKIEGTITMWLDANKRIMRFEMETTKINGKST